MAPKEWQWNTCRIAAHIDPYCGLSVTAHGTRDLYTLRREENGVTGRSACESNGVCFTIPVFTRLHTSGLPADINLDATLREISA